MFNMALGKQALVDKLAEKEGITKKAADETVTLFFDSIIDSLAEGKTVQLTGFGKFETYVRAARKGRNPQTGEEIDIPAKRVPRYKSGKAVKDAIK